MAGLAEYLKAEIQKSGPISMTHYMEACLTHPQLGYYVTRDPLGAAGDFVTAPEISQMFGELIGLWVIDIWQKLGRPDPLQLVELGPGRGTFMEDILRSFNVAPDLKKAVQINLVETSPVLRAAQGERVMATWHEDLSSIDRGPMILVANEFFDALPIHQFQRTDQGWKEVLVDWINDRFATVHGEPGEAIKRLSATVRHQAISGQIAEVAPAALDLCTAIGSRIAADGGAALIIDYGYAVEATGETLQAVKDHQYAPILENAGQADLSAHVNFAALGRSLHETGCVVWGPVFQADFLNDLGIRVRAERLMEAASAEQNKKIGAALRRLTSAEQMGRLFRVMAVSQTKRIQPLGFE